MRRISGCFGANCGFTRYRGDGWQIYLDNPGYGLWAAVRIAATLRAAGGLESRIAIGLGKVERVDLSNLSTGSGTAFLASGRSLNDMPNTWKLVLAGEGTDRIHQSLMRLIDATMTRWSVHQAEAAALAWSKFPHPTMAEIGEMLGISRQAVAARLQTAGFEAIDWAQWQFFQHFSTRSGTSHA
jgi:hypothetical protein